MSDKPASPARGRKKTAPPAQQPPQEEVVVRLPLTDLYPFPDHPFQVRDDEEMRETIQSVKEYGVIVPAIVRPREEGGYELVAGHRRHHASMLAGLETMPVIVREMDDLAKRKAEAEASLAEVERRIADVEAECAKLLEEGRAQAERIKASILAEAEKEAAHIVEQAKAGAEQEGKAECLSG